MNLFARITLEVLENRLPQGVVLNVNFPKLTKDNIKGIKICRRKSTLDRKFDKRQTPQGRLLLACGEFVNQDKGEDTDEWALGNGYVSVVPVQFDLHTMPHKNSTLGNGMNKADLLKGFLRISGSVLVVYAFITLFTPMIL
jgi:broad specificity polyphosphatase/5'/3'-nucleotidase SurE